VVDLNRYIEKFLSNKWRAATLLDQVDVIVWDEVNEYLAKLPSYTFTKLQRNQTNQGQSMKAILQHGSMNVDESQAEAELPYQATLSLLGSYILVRCRHKACLEGITEYFSTALCETWCTADIVIDCQWEKAERYLFRARPVEDPIEHLAGVRVHMFGRLALEDWPYKEPPLPPFLLEPFVNRFVGLHAAAVEAPNGKGLVVVGNQGSGKTTISVDITNNYGCHILTDETTFIHRRTRFVEPFVGPIGLRDKNSSKRIVPASKVCQRIAMKPVSITHLVFLEAADIQRGELLPIDANTTFRFLLKHHLNVGCTIDEAVVTLLQLSRSVSSALFRYGAYKDLLDAGVPFMDFIQ